MIIGLSGFIGSGKGTVAKRLVNHHGFVELSFASHLKDVIAVMFGWPRKMLEGDTHESRVWREQLDPFWSELLGRNWSPRIAMQVIGTDVVRDKFYDGMWVANVLKTVQQNPNANYVISDVRFSTEIEVCSQMGATMVRVTNGKDPSWADTMLTHGIIPKDVHRSEWEWLYCGTYNYVIKNTSTLDALANEVDSFVSSLG